MRQPLEVLRGRLEVIAPHIVSRALWCEVGGREEEARWLVGALLRWLALPAEGAEGVEGVEGAEGAEGAEGRGAREGLVHEGSPRSPEVSRLR